jgi:hypothetical protein
MYQAQYTEAFERFMSDKAAVRAAIDSATSADYGGSGYTLELFGDGTFRTLWNGHIGNLYNSRGIMIAIPELNDDDLGAPEAGIENFYDSAIDELRRNFEMAFES